jgi:AcrR family transcriptional regulator
MITDTASGSTKDRLVTEGLRLFAAHGFRATTVGEIEAAAGLQPRRGALYRHFASKEELLSEAVRRHVEAVREGRDWMLALPAGDVRTEALVLGRFVLDELARERQIVDVFEQEGERLTELRDVFRQRISDASYQAMTEMLRRWAGSGSGDADLDAYGVLVLGALVNVHRSTWTFGGPPRGLDEERMLAGWADLCVDVVRRVA